MAFLPIILAAFIGSCLSFFCGFGLGTLLLPAFLLFFPPEVAIAASAVVHMLNNIFKLGLVGRQADWHVVKTFGLWSVVGALAGALCLDLISGIPPLFSYHIGHSIFVVDPLKMIVGIIILTFAFIEILPSFRSIRIGPEAYPFGGIITGFFGGLSGHQGALRSAFLMKSGLSKEAFIGTRVVCACLVDVTRIVVYATAIRSSWKMIDPWLVVAGSGAAFLGAWLGNKWMKKTEIRSINIIISISLVLFALAMILGMV